jgi:hypothetical protein
MPYVHPLSGQEEPPPPPVMINDEVEYEVEAIIKKK